MSDRQVTDGASPRPSRRKQIPWKGRPAADEAAGRDGSDRPEAAAADARSESEQVAAVHAQNRAAADQAMRERGRQIGGVAGAALAGMMVALRDIYERAPKDQGAVVVDSPSEPHDADRDGMRFGADEVDGRADVAIEAQERREPILAPARRRRRRR